MLNALVPCSSLFKKNLGLNLSFANVVVLDYFKSCMIRIRAGKSFTVYVFRCTVQSGLPSAGTSCTVYAFRCTVQSGLPSVESTQHVLCNKCSLARTQWVQLPYLILFIKVRIRFPSCSKTNMKFCIMLIGICVFSSKNVSKRMVSYFSPDIFYRSEILCFPIGGVYFITFLPALTYTHTFRLFMYNVHWSQQTA